MAQAMSPSVSRILGQSSLLLFIGIFASPTAYGREAVISWNTVPGADFYILYWSPRSFREGRARPADREPVESQHLQQALIRAPNTDYTLNLGEQDYFFRLRAGNDGGQLSGFNVDYFGRQVEVPTRRVSPPCSQSPCVRLRRNLSPEGGLDLHFKVDRPGIFPQEGPVSLGLGSRSLDLFLIRSPEDPSIYSASLPEDSLNAGDILSMENEPFSVSVDGVQLPADFEANVLSGHRGGTVEETEGGARATLNPDSLIDDARLLVQAAESSTERDLALERNRLQSLGPARRFDFRSPYPYLEPFTIEIPFQRGLLPVDRALSNVGLALFDEGKGTWRKIPSRLDEATGFLAATVDQFSVYMPVLFQPEAAPGLKEAFTFPNPALPFEEPIIRAKLGVVDSVEITIFDLSGAKVHSATLPGAPTGISKGEYYYDYRWTGRIATGVYFALLLGEKGGKSVHAKVTFAVIR